MNDKQDKRFSIEQISSGRLPAVMKLAEFADGVGMGRRYAQRLAQQGRIPATLTCGRYYVDTRAALTQLGVVAGEEA